MKCEGVIHQIMFLQHAFFLPLKCMPQSRPHKRGKNREQSSSRGSFMVTDDGRERPNGERGTEGPPTQGRDKSSGDR